MCLGFKIGIKEGLIQMKKCLLQSLKSMLKEDTFLKTCTTKDFAEMYGNCFLLLLTEEMAKRQNKKNRYFKKVFFGVKLRFAIKNKELIFTILLIRLVCCLKTRQVISTVKKTNTNLAFYS